MGAELAQHAQQQDVPACDIVFCDDFDWQDSAEPGFPAADEGTEAAFLGAADTGGMGGQHTGAATVQPVGQPGSSTQAGPTALSRKRMRDELCEKIIKEVLEEKSQSRVGLQPLVNCLSRILDQARSAAGPQSSPTVHELLALRAQSLAQGTIPADTSPQRFLMAALMLAQQWNASRAAGTPAANGLCQLLELRNTAERGGVLLLV
ncbi:hypothetical protein WJX72_005305 [[Myrmecia] bisecta]|uniref:Uncharacterized protein n=1 Tax=[Myrmecia] bisecta TaxID=41462 RepID=A0AAW1QAQ7_9CHLO